MGIAKKVMSYKKCLIVNPYWDTMGGGENYAASVARLLLKRGWNVDIKWDTPLVDKIKKRFSIELNGVNFVNDPYTARYDLVFWVSDGSLPLSFAKKTIIHFQFPFTKTFGIGFLEYIKKRIYKIVCNSNFTKTFIDKTYGVKSQVVFPPVSTTLFKPKKKTNTILYVGRFSDLTQAKGQKHLITAFRSLNKSLKGWKLVLAGGAAVGFNKASLDDLKAHSKGLPVEIVLNPSFEKLQDLYGQSRFFWSASGYGVDENIFPLKVEHFGMSVVEAMSSGCVPLVTNLGGHKEIIESGRSGFLWNSLEELVEVTSNLIKNPQLVRSVSQEAEKRSVEFDSSRFYSNMWEVIK